MIAIKPFVAGDWHDGETTTTVYDVYRRTPAAELHHSSREQVTTALRALATAVERVRLTPYQRYQVLARASELVQARASEFVETLVTETGFVLADARREVDRTVQTLLLSGEEAKRLKGEVVPIDADPTHPRRVGFTQLRPVGVVCAITPFNSPLNTVAHKVAPAIAAGNAVILKPAAATPLSSDLLLRTLLEAGLPPELISVVHGEGATVGDWLLTDETPAFYAFTGSTGVGLHIQRTIGVRRAQLELGSLSSTMVCADANIGAAAALCAKASFRKAGQVCTSVQRLYVDEAVTEEFQQAMLAELDGRRAGDPRNPETFVGPLINESAAERASTLIETAVAAGARVLTGGNRNGLLLDPTVLSDVALDMDVMCTEAFSPIVSVRPFKDVNDALAEANDTPYGLTAGLFTQSIGTAMDLAGRLHVGTVHVNETSSSRLDLMPFGGIKASGHGREGPAYAVREMSDEVLITLGG